MMTIDLAHKEGSEGREDFQAGWHKFFNEAYCEHNSNTVLDIGSGLGMIKDRIPRVTTSDIYPGNLCDYHRSLWDFSNDSYDYVTMFDVIEHISDDISFLEQASKVARKAIFLTTPNFLISLCSNEYHYREYIPKQFAHLCRQIEHTHIQYFGGTSSGDTVHINMSESCEHLGAMIYL